LKRAGITLPEVLIALIIMVLGILPVLTLYGSEDRESAFIGQKLMVANHLRELADQTQSTLFARHFADGAFEDPKPGEPVVEKVLGGTEVGLKVKQRIQVYPSDKVAGLYVLRVQAQWVDPTGSLPGVREHVLQRLVADPEFGSRRSTWPPVARAAAVVGP
jgi:hypothetical protein